MERLALKAFMKPNENTYQQYFDEDCFTNACNKVRNNLACIHAISLVLAEHIDGFFDLLREGQLDVNDKVKKQMHDFRELKDSINVLKSKLIQSVDSGLKIGDKKNKHKQNDAVDCNYDIVDAVLRIAMDCQHNGSFNDNGKILAEMPESLFNTLKFPKYAIDQMNVYGSTLERRDQFIE